MAKQSLNGALQHLRKMAAVQTYRRVSDRELLERFVGERDEAAFTVMIERHGPMVLGVCRRALSNSHDAEDACQATFLVLARRAASVRKKTSLSSWLHGVACRVAAKLTRDYARRKKRERRVDAPAPKDPAAEVTWREVQATLDAELQRLPDRFRTPLILCYLECMTRDEAAQQLGLSLGSLHGRLERARDLLRELLTKRGLTLSAVMTAAALGEKVQAALAPTIVVSSTKAAMLLVAGQPLTESVVAKNVLALTQEVLKNMFLTKLKLGTGAALCAGLVVAMIGGAFNSLSIAQDARSRSDYFDNSLVANLATSQAKDESDADFIRRISKDLRGTEPTPAEIHFFVASKDAGRRQKLIDLFIQERQAKKATEEDFFPPALALIVRAPSRIHTSISDGVIGGKSTNKEVASQSMPTGLWTLQKEFYKELHTAKEKGDIAKVTQAYLDRLIDFVRTNPKSQDASDAMRQIVLVYESQGKTVEAGAWRDKMLKEHPRTSSGTAPKVIDKEGQSKAKLPNSEPATTTLIGNLAVTLPFAVPTAEEILRALPAKARPKDARIQCELLNYKLDDARDYPGVGRARLVHVHFKCTVSTEGGGVEIVYIDRDHLIPQK
jgi:RNA polymerase sigma factor (sigma-70 family)